MATVLEKIESYLKTDRVRYRFDAEGDVLLTNIEHKGQAGALYIRTKEGGKIFTWDMQPLTDDKSAHLIVPADHPHIAPLFLEMLVDNFKSRYGSWEYNPSDGDIKFTISFPIENGALTHLQFQCIASGTFNALVSQAKFKKILETGKVPEEGSLEGQPKAVPKKKATRKKKSSVEENDGI